MYVIANDQTIPQNIYTLSYFLKSQASHISEMFTTLNDRIIYVGKIKMFLKNYFEISIILFDALFILLFSVSFLKDVSKQCINSKVNHKILNLVNECHSKLHSWIDIKCIP